MWRSTTLFSFILDPKSEDYSRIKNFENSRIENFEIQMNSFFELLWY